MSNLPYAASGLAGMLAASLSSYGLPELSMASMTTASFLATATFALRFAIFPPRAHILMPWRLMAVSGDDVRMT
jgi:hypothetical protein